MTTKTTVETTFDGHDVASAVVATVDLLDLAVLWSPPDSNARKRLLQNRDDLAALARELRSARGLRLCDPQTSIRPAQEHGSDRQPLPTPLFRMEPTGTL